MAVSRHTLIVILFFTFLFLLAQCSKASSDKETPSPAPTIKDEEEEDSSPAPSPAEEEEEEEEEEDDEEEEKDTGESSPTPTPNPSSGPAAESPLSINELFELSLPEIGVQKVATTPPGEGAKISIKQLEGIEHKIVEFKTSLTKRVSKPSSKASKKCLTQCQGNFDDAVDGVKKGIESIKKQDLNKANIDISGIATDIETCNDCFIDGDGEDKEINAFNSWIKGVTKECLSLLK
ncbi:hypothetical protein R6Q59_023666 [Mikania micrantha]